MSIEEVQFTAVIILRKTEIVTFWGVDCYGDISKFNQRCSDVLMGNLCWQWANQPNLANGGLQHAQPHEHLRALILNKKLPLELIVGSNILALIRRKIRR